MARREFDKQTRRDAFLRADGKCEGEVDGHRCGAKLTIGKFAYDHRIPDRLGGEPVLSNCQVLCSACHTVKTRQDAKDIAHTRHLEDARIGIKGAPRQKMRGKPFPKSPRRRPASDPIPKLADLPRRSFTESTR